ncbi:MAG: sigma-70 family RNA polymerase sigma factor, partial [Verrucomicrobiota bacterium]
LRRHEDLDTAFALASGEDAPDAAAERAERVAGVRAAIAALPAHLRSVVILSEYEHLSQAEIAAVEGITVKAVETRLARAREKLKKMLRAPG